MYTSFKIINAIIYFILMIIMTIVFYLIAKDYSIFEYIDNEKNVIKEIIYIAFLLLVSIILFAILVDHEKIEILAHIDKSNNKYITYKKIDKIDFILHKIINNYLTTVTLIIHIIVVLFIDNNKFRELTGINNINIFVLTFSLYINSVIMSSLFTRYNILIKK